MTALERSRGIKLAPVFVLLCNYKEHRCDPGYEIRKYLKREGSSFFIFTSTPVSSGFESAINAFVLISFGAESKVESFVAVVVVEFCEAESVDVPAVATLCETELNHRCSSDVLRIRNCRCLFLVILVTKYNVHPNKLHWCCCNNF